MVPVGGRWSTPLLCRSVRARLRVSLVTAGPAIVLLVLGWLRRWTAEDAFIDFRVVSNLLGGHGPVFNPGQRVEAYTSPLWILVLTVGHGLLRVRVEWLAALLGLGFSAAAVAVGGRAAMRLANGG